MLHLDCFSGIGGFALAASWVWGRDHYIHSFIEIDPFCQKVLNKHWPEVSIQSDIREYKHDGTAIDLLTAGFPCPPFSVAGKRRGKKDHRYIWAETFEVIQEVQPSWIIIENVAGIVKMALDSVLSDLENEGYTCQAFIIPACAVNAPHRRDRVWVVANASGKGLQGEGIQLPVTECHWRESWLEVAPRLCRMDARVSARVDRFRALGNAIVPQVASSIMRCIKRVGVYN